MNAAEIRRWQERVEQMKGPPQLVFNQELVIAVLEVALQLALLREHRDRAAASESSAT